jgi:hypothetical protein
MRPDELGPTYEEHVRQAGGDPNAPSVQHGYDAFVATLTEPLEGRDGPLDTYGDVLLFEVGRWRAEQPGGPSGLIVNLDRRIFLGHPSDPEMLKIEWRFDEDAELVQHDGYDVMGRGPGLPATEGMVVLKSFLAEVETSPVLARIREIKPLRTRVWIESSS